MEQPYSEEVEQEHLHLVTRWLPERLRRYARLCVSTKAEQGRLVFNIFYSYPFLSTLIWPERAKKANTEHVWAQFKLKNRWMWFIEKTRLVRLIHAYQRLVFNIVCLRAAYKWPHLLMRIFANELEFDKWLYEWTQRKIVRMHHKYYDIEDID